MRLRGADWNDALDMAEDRGESVAFTCAYAGNLKQLANYIRMLKNNHGQQEIEILKEMKICLMKKIVPMMTLQEKRKFLILM